MNVYVAVKNLHLYKKEKELNPHVQKILIFLKLIKDKFNKSV